MHRKTYLKIDLNVLKNNVTELLKEYYEYRYYIGVVKANAYGHGDSIVKELIQCGINYLAVSSLEEALRIRTFNQEIPILVFGHLHLEDLEICSTNHITMTLHDYEQYLQISNMHFSIPLKIHIKLNTGMNRLGIKELIEVDTIVAGLKRNASFVLEGIYSHLATSGINDKHYDHQIERFKYLTSNIDLKTIPMVHLSRSLTLVTHPKLDFCNSIRFGIAMYGFSQSMGPLLGLKGKIKSHLIRRNQKKYHISPTSTKNNLQLKTAMTLYSEIIQITKVKKGEFIGYGASYIAKEDLLVATIPIGYADGLHPNMDTVYIQHKPYPIIGGQCMDMIMVRVDETIHRYDQVTIMGEELDLLTLSRKLNMNAHHLVTMIHPRVPRIYYLDEEKKEYK